MSKTVLETRMNEVKPNGKESASKVTDKNSTERKGKNKKQSDKDGAVLGKINTDPKRH